MSQWEVLQLEQSRQEKWFQPPGTVKVDTRERLSRVRVQHQGRMGTRVTRAAPEFASLEDLVETAVGDTAMGPVLRTGLGETYPEDLPVRQDADEAREPSAIESAALGIITWRRQVLLRAGSREVSWGADRRRVVLGIRRPESAYRLALVDPARAAGVEPLLLLDHYELFSRDELAAMLTGTSYEGRADWGAVTPCPPRWLLSPVALAAVLAARWKERLLAPASEHVWPPNLTIRDPARDWPTDLEGTTRHPVDLVTNGRPVARPACIATGGAPDELTGHGGFDGVSCDEMQVLPWPGAEDAAGGPCVGVATMRPLQNATGADLYACTLLAGAPGDGERPITALVRLPSPERMVAEGRWVGEEQFGDAGWSSPWLEVDATSVPIQVVSVGR